MKRPHPHSHPALGWLLAAATCCGLSACGGTQRHPETGLEVPALPSSAPPAAEISVLMLGNSHTSAQALPQQLEGLLRARFPGQSVAVVEAPNWLFLDERLSDPLSQKLLSSQPWRAVVLQAQKYSSSGAYHYSTAAAEQWVQAVRRQQALPLLFPEWPRRGIDETARIYELHVSIARKQPACVAPIGQAWDLALQRHPELRLHASDGNHSAAAGAHLAALMLYATLTGDSALALLPLLPELHGISTALQTQLRQIAADTAARVPPRQHCPKDGPWP